MRLRQQRDRLAPTVAALLSSGYPALRRFECAFGLTIPARMKDARPVGEGGERFNPQVDAGLLSSWRQGSYWHINTGEADIPAIGFPAERDSLGRALQGARPAHGDAPNLGQDQEAIVERRAIAELLVGEGVIASRVPGSAGSPLSLRPLPDERTLDTSCRAATAHLARHGYGWPRTPAWRRECPSTPLPAESARVRRPHGDRR